MRGIAAWTVLWLAACGSGGAPGGKPDAAVETPRKRLLRLKRQEVDAMFAELRVAEERYRVEFGAYLSTGPEGTWWPEELPGDTRVAPGAPPAAWRQLGIKLAPEGQYCQYNVVVGAPGEGKNMGDEGRSLYEGRIPTTSWFYLLARCGEDNDPLPARYLQRGDRDSGWAVGERR